MIYHAQGEHANHYTTDVVNIHHVNWYEKHYGIPYSESYIYTRLDEKIKHKHIWIKHKQNTESKTTQLHN
jgi:hypothetical protein